MFSYERYEDESHINVASGRMSIRELADLVRAVCTLKRASSLMQASLTDAAKSSRERGTNGLEAEDITRAGVNRRLNVPRKNIARAVQPNAQGQSKNCSRTG